MRNFRISFIALLLFWPGDGWPDDRPIAYTLSGPRSELDDLVEKHFGTLYKIVEIDQRSHTYVGPHFRSIGPLPPVYVDGQCVSGRTLVLLVITDKGTVASTYVASATNPALSEPTAAGAAKRIYDPATLDGAPVSVVLGVQYDFKCP